MRTVIKAHAVEVEIGDYVAWVDAGECKRIEARKIIRDCGCIHIWTDARVVTFQNMFPVEIMR